jgi:hypothetical protein
MRESGFRTRGPEPEPEVSVRRSTAVMVLLIMIVVAGSVAGAVVAVLGSTSTPAASGGAVAGGELPAEGSPDETATKYLEAWARDDIAAMRSLVDTPPADFEERHGRLVAGLRVTNARFKLGTVREQPDGSVTASFEATMSLTGMKPWRYKSALKLVGKDDRWLVEWTPRTVHPDLVSGARLVRGTAWPKRAAILAADGSALNTRAKALGATQITGSLGPATAEDLEELGEPYKADDAVGHGGLQEAFERQLAGSPGDAIQVVAADGKVRKTLRREGGKAGKAVRTTIDPKVQAAAAKAIAGASNPTFLVALRPSDGRVLAVAAQPVGYDKAFLGKYPPGSTFKVVSAAALVAGGLDPGTRVDCPAQATVQGKTFRNAGGESLGTVPFHDAFAHSCNTTFARLAADRLSGDRLRQVAGQFGFGAPLIPGLPAERGRVPPPVDDVELAADAIGQGRVLASPLHMATVAGAIANGTWRPPRLVTGKVPTPAGVTPAQPRRLEAGVVSALRRLMPAVVNEGTASRTSFPPGTAGKTGTAEYGTGPNPPAHAWFIGYRGDLAFAVLQEDGGFGADSAAPIAADFLRRL